MLDMILACLVCPVAHGTWTSSSTVWVIPLPLIFLVLCAVELQLTQFFILEIFWLLCYKNFHFLRIRLSSWSLWWPILPGRGGSVTLGSPILMRSNRRELVRFRIPPATCSITAPFLQHPAFPPSELLLSTGPQLELDWQGHLRHLRYLGLEHTANRPHRTASFIGVVLLRWGLSVQWRRHTKVSCLLSSQRTASMETLCH